MARWVASIGWLVLVAGCSGGGSPLDGADGGLDGAPPDADVAIGMVQGRVFEAASALPLAGAVIKARVGDQVFETMADAQGRFELAVPEADAVVVTAELAAHAKGVEVTAVRKDAESYVESFVAKVEASGQVDASAQSKFTGPLGSSIELPAGGLVDSTGATVTGSVDVEMTPINPKTAAGLRAVPGLPVLKWADGREDTAEVKAPMTMALRKDGLEVNLAPGASARVEIPAFDPLGPAQMKLYSLDETTGKWSEEGTVHKVQTAAGPVYKGVVTHLSSWAGGRTVNRTCVRGCVVDDGAPVSGARVRLAGVDFDFRGSVTTDGEGCFVVDTKAGGQVRIGAATPTGAAIPRVVVASTDLMEASTDPTACQDVGTLTIEPAADPDDACPRGFAHCAEQCVDLDADPQHCGTCGWDCQDGTDGVQYDRCVGGSCTCASSHLVCDMACTDTTSDPANCGVCGMTCSPTEECVEGTCVAVECEGGLEPCGEEGPPVCTDLATDPFNCGTCGFTCDVGVDCSAGTCVEDGMDGGVPISDGGTADAGFDSGTYDSGTVPEEDAGFDSGTYDSGTVPEEDAGFDSGTYDSGTVPEEDGGGWEDPDAGGVAPE
jgi:hypothetical protein